MSTQMTDHPNDEQTPDAPPRGRRGWWIAGVIALVALLGVGWYLVEPALFDDTVDTVFEVSIDQAQTGDAGAGVGDSSATNQGDTQDAPGDPMDGAPFPEQADDEPAVAESSPVEEPAAAVSEPAAEEQPIVPEPEPEGPVLVSSGEFRGLDNHDASGQAAVFTQSDGTRVIRLENLDADNGPELELHLVPGVDQTRPGEGTLIAPLQGNQGNQTYVIPESFDVPDTATVLIWCVPFRVAIGGASLTPA